MMEFRNGIFIITEENHCPLYNVGEEFVVAENSLKLPSGKNTCLILARDILMIAASEGQAFERFSKGENQSAKFECGGCSGIIRFEFKKDKEFATLQMKLMAAADRKDKIKQEVVFAGLLRSIDLFKTLSDDDLLDLAALMQLESYEWGFPIALKGEQGTNLFIIVSGRVEIVDDEGVTLAEMGPGDVFGEMSLLTGDKVTATILAAEPSKIARMSQKNFRHILDRFPTLQVFFYKLLVSRITATNLKRAEELSSGMVGQLTDIPPADLCQMINSLQKSGRLIIDAGDIKATLIFYEGEVIQADFNEISGKDAFYKILTMGKGRFKFVQGLTAAEKRKDVIGGFMAMLMEGMRRIDDLP
jgi:CRP/FNR family cyclic AMP-dependent transcriptional regulator